MQNKAVQSISDVTEIKALHELSTIGKDNFNQDKSRLHQYLSLNKEGYFSLAAWLIQSSLETKECFIMLNNKGHRAYHFWLCKELYLNTKASFEGYSNISPI